MTKSIFDNQFLTVPCTDFELQFREKPQLPNIKYKVGKYTYTITALSYLNETAIDLFVEMVCEVVDSKNFDGVTYAVPADTDEEKLGVVEDIILSLSYGCKRRGYFLGGNILVGSFKRHYCDGKIKSVTFDFLSEHAKYIYEYFHDGCKPLDVEGSDSSNIQKLLLLLAIAIKEGYDKHDS